MRVNMPEEIYPSLTRFWGRFIMEPDRTSYGPNLIPNWIDPQRSKREELLSKPNEELTLSKLPTTGTGKSGLKPPSQPTSTPAPCGQDYFYAQFGPFWSCFHPSFYLILDYNTGEARFCGLCWLTSLFESEFPSRLHLRRDLADNGNPQTSPQFWAHLEASLGLIPPKPGQNLSAFRLARGQLYAEPSKRQFPVTRALWDMMGTQPPLAKVLVKRLFGATELELSREFDQSLYATHTSLAKAIRLALRNVRALNRGASSRTTSPAA